MRAYVAKSALCALAILVLGFAGASRASADSSQVVYFQPDSSTPISGVINTFTLFTGASGIVTDFKFAYSDGGSSVDWVGLAIVDRTTGTNYFAYDPAISTTCGDIHKGQGLNQVVIVDLGSSTQYRSGICDGSSLVLDPTHTYSVGLFLNEGSNGLQMFYGSPNREPYLYIAVSPTCTENCFSNVLFIPGIEASRLYDTRSDGSEDQLWEPNGNNDVEDLYLNPEGTSENDNVYTRDIVKETNTPVSTGSLGVNIYKSFSNEMDSLKDTDQIADWQAFAYDWRESPDDVVNTPQKYGNGQMKSLTEVLQSLVDSSKTGNVTIITHSNGGLVAKVLLKKLQQDKVDSINNLIDHVDVLIMVAAPQIGTPSAIPAILHGYGQALGPIGLLMDNIHARELGRYMPGAYSLLPSFKYINNNPSPVTFVDNAIPSNVTTKMFQTFGSALNSYSEYKSFLLGGEGRTEPDPTDIIDPISLSSNLFTKAESLHDNIDNWTPPASLKIIQIAGWGPDTVGSFEYYPVCNQLSTTCELDERPRITMDGDGTVVTPSALYMGGDNARYWFNMYNYNQDTSNNYVHKNILEASDLLTFISNIIEGIPNNSVYINTVAPVSTDNKFQLSVHSPVTIDAYDMNGNHTGKVCPVGSDFCYAEENIPNSSYMEFGEGKYLNLPEDKVQTVKLQGTGSGTFTFDADLVTPDGQTTSSSFVDVPVTPQTQAQVTFDQHTSLPELALDKTGDGTTDVIILSDGTQILSLNELLDQLTQKIQSLTLTDKQKQNLLKKITNLETKIENKKEKNAKILSNIDKRISNQALKGKIDAASADQITTLLDQLEAQSDSVALDPDILADLATKIQALNIKANIKTTLLNRVAALQKKQGLVATLSNLSKNITIKSQKGKITDGDTQAILDTIDQITSLI